MDLKPLTGCMRSMGTARERSIAVGADWARSTLAAKKRVDCMAAVGRCGRNGEWYPRVVVAALLMP